MTVLTVSPLLGFRSKGVVRKAHRRDVLGLESCPVESVRLRTSGGTRCRIRGSRGNGRPAAPIVLHHLESELREETAASTQERCSWQPFATRQLLDVNARPWSRTSASALNSSDTCRC